MTSYRLTMTERRLGYQWNCADCGNRSPEPLMPRGKPKLCLCRKCRAIRTREKERR